MEYKENSSNFEKANNVREMYTKIDENEEICIEEQDEEEKEVPPDTTLYQGPGAGHVALSGREPLGFFRSLKQGGCLSQGRDNTGNCRGHVLNHELWSLLDGNDH